MWLIDAFVHNPVKVAVGAILLVLFGLISFMAMPMQLTPEVEIPKISIETRWPGASPTEVEREIVQEQEEQLKAVEGMTKMTAECADSQGTITLEFAVGTDLSEALLKVNSRLQQVEEYPEEAKEPVISTSDPRANAIAWFILRPRVASREEIAALQQKHAQVAELLEPARRAHNVGLRTRRLQQLWEEHPELRELIAPLMPTDVNVPELKRFAEDFIEARFERVDGVSNANVYGGREEELQVTVDPQRLAARGLTIADLRRALQEENRDISAGDVWEGKRRWVVRTLGRLRSPEQVGDVIVAQGDQGEPVYVRDVADVAPGFKKPTAVVRNFGTTCIAINAVRKTGANVLDAMDGLKEANAKLNRTLLAQRGLELIQVYDETDYIYASVDLVQWNIIIGGVLTIGVLLLFLRSWRSTIVIAIAIPTSLIGTFLLLNLMDRSLNVISLAGLAFAVGMLVDNAVVVLENVYRHSQMGDNPLKAAVRGATEVWGAVVASTLTTLAVFLPVLFVQEEAGQLFRDIALAISCAVGLSLIVSITVIPTASARLLRRRRGTSIDEEDEEDGDGNDEGYAEQHGEDLSAQHAFDNGFGHADDDREGFADEVVAAGDPVAARASVASEDDRRANDAGKHRHGVGGRLAALLAPPLRLADRLAERFVNHVVHVNGAVQRRHWLRWTVVLGFVAVALGLSWLMMPKVEYLPAGNRNLVIAVLLPPPGYNVDKTLEMGRQLEEATEPLWNVDPEDAAAMDKPAIADYFFVASPRRVLMGTRAMQSQRVGQLVGVMQAKAGQLPGTFAIASQRSLFSSELGSGRKIDVEISGPDLPRLVAMGQEIMGQLQEVMPPGTRTLPRPSLDLSSPEVHVIRKPKQASDMQMPTNELGYAVDALIDGAYATDYYKEGDKIDLTIVGAPSFAERTQDIADLPVATPTGDLSQIEGLARVDLAGGPEQINRRERQRAITLEVTPPLDLPLEEAIERIEQNIIQPRFESGELGGAYQMTLAGTADKLRATWNALRWNFVLALLITYLLMAALFESWLYPLVIILSVPLGAVGGLIGLWAVNVYLAFWPYTTPQTLDVLTMLGFVILIGTVVNNPILIVHQALNHMRDEQMAPDRAVLESVRIRIRPIFMTTATTVLGLCPLVLFPGAGSELYRGLGAVVLGGLLVSTATTLLIVPTMFSLAMDLKMRSARLLGRRTQEMTAAEEPERPVAEPAAV